MLNSIKVVLGLTKSTRKKAKLPEGLEHLEVISAKRWWK